VLLVVVEVNECGVCIKRMTVAKADNGLDEADDEKTTLMRRRPYFISRRVFLCFARTVEGCCFSEGYGQPLCPSSVHLPTSRC